MRNLRVLWRGALQNPFTTGVGVLTMGLALATTSILLGAFWEAYVRPLPVKGMDRLVFVSGLSNPLSDDPITWWSQLKSVELLASFDIGRIPVEASNLALRPLVTAISPKFFQVLEVQPMLGRMFTPQDEADSGRLAIISYAFWSSHFASTGALDGLYVRLRGISYAVIGVMPAHVNFPGSTEVWVPRTARKELGLKESSTESMPVKFTLGCIARLADGASVNRLVAEATAMLHHMNTVLSPRTNVQYGESVSVLPLAVFISRDIRPIIIGLLIGAVLVLVIAMANASALFLSRFAAGSKDAAVRVACGASPTRLVWEILTEALTLTWVSGGIGVVIAILFWVLLGRSAIHDYAPQLSENWATDILIFMSCFCLATIAGAVTGLSSATMVAKQEPNEVLQGRAGLGKSRGRTFRRILIASEIALACSVLTAADLAISSVITLNHINFGFTPNGVLTAQCDLPRVPTDAAAMGQVQRQKQILTELRNDPAVLRAGASSLLPMSGAVAGKLYLWSGNYSTSAFEFIVSDDYFRILHIPILAGRAFSASDGEVVIVSRRLANRLWPGRNPVGQSIRLDGETFSRDVIGSVDDVNIETVENDPEPQMYLSINHPFLSRVPGKVNFVIQCRGGCTSLARSLQDRMLNVAGASIYGWMPYDDIIEHLMAPIAARAYLLGAFAFCAALISCAGVFAMASYGATSRTFEVGVCGALGARPLDILVMLVEEAVGCTFAGLVSGTLLAGVFAAFIHSMIVGISPFNPASYARSTFILLLGALIGSLAPSMRLARIEISQALRTRAD